MEVHFSLPLGFFLSLYCHVMTITHVAELHSRVTWTHIIHACAKVFLKLLRRILIIYKCAALLFRVFKYFNMRSFIYFAVSDKHKADRNPVSCRGKFCQYEIITRHFFAIHNRKVSLEIKHSKTIGEDSCVSSWNEEFRNVTQTLWKL